MVRQLVDDGIAAVFLKHAAGNQAVGVDEFLAVFRMPQQVDEELAEVHVRRF